MEEAPFPSLKIDQTDFLDNLASRSKCPKCGKSRKYYCYTCYVPVREIEGRVPKIKLPVKVDIIKHPSECDGKSTAVHAGVICPEDVAILTYPCIPDYNKDKTLLVFPGESALTMEELAKQLCIARDITEPFVNNQYHEDVPSTIDNELDNNDKKVVDRVYSEKNKTRDYERAGYMKNEICNNERTKQPKANSLGISTERIENASIENTETVETNSQLGFQEEATDKVETEIILVSNSNSGAHVDRDKTETDSKTVVSLAPFDRVVFVDSTWNQTRSICNDERLKGLKCIELKTRKTKFWRHQDDVPDTYLSTVEAIYYFMIEYHEMFMISDYKGEYDNLLFFFTYMYQKIRKLYDGGNDLRAYKKRKVTHN